MCLKWREIIIDFHFVFKVKVEEIGKKRLKARMCPDVNQDKLKGKIRNDSATACFDKIRVLLSLPTIKRMQLFSIDVKGTYLQSRPIGRRIHVRASRELQKWKSYLYRLLKLPYRISEAGRQLAKTFESWFLGGAGSDRIDGVRQTFVRSGNGELISLMMAKVTEDL